MDKILKVFLFIFLYLIIFYVNSANAIVNISSDDLLKYKGLGYSISERFTSINICNSTKEGYNVSYPDYIRSECFFNGDDYYYFICSKELTCSLSINAGSGTIITNGNNSLNPYLEFIPSSYMDSINKIIDSFKEYANTLSADEYLKLKEAFYGKLTLLKNKYSTNKQIIYIIKYLKFEIDKINQKDTDLDDFLCELTGTCTTVNGVCGSVNGSTVITKPTDNLCLTGTASVVSGTGPWTWTCIGRNGGTTASCSAKARQIEGTCGTANNGTFATKPTDNLCLTGTASVVSGTGPWTWTCIGSNGGATASCSAKATQMIEGTCGTANNGTFATKPTDNLCLTGTASVVSGTGPWTWTCIGSNGGATASCSAKARQIEGTCGTANNGTFATKPTDNLCLTGTASVVSGTGPWTWTCSGSNGGATASCSAKARQIEGTCGTANNGTFATKPTDNLCLTGTASVVSGTGPWTWTCSGSNGGATASCSAKARQIEGTCGTANNGTFATKPTDNLCLTGTASVVSGTGPWTWTCSGSNGGATASCNAKKLISTIESKKGALKGVIYLSSDSNGNITSQTPVSNTLLNEVSYPFNGINCPSGYTRVGTGMRPEDDGKTFYQVYTCVKTSGETDLSEVERGTLMGIIYLKSDSKGTIISQTPTSSNVLDSVRFPFDGISCPTGFQRISLGMRPEEGGKTFYQVYTCAKTDGNENLAGIEKGSALGIILLKSDSKGNLLSTTPSSNVLLSSVMYPFNGILCPTGFQRVGTGLRPEEEGKVFYQIYTCIKTQSIGSTPINGTCGTANNGTFATIPTYNLCGQGTASDVSGTGPWTWTCSGTNGGTTAYCSAFKSIVTEWENVPTTITDDFDTNCLYRAYGNNSLGKYTVFYPSRLSSTEFVYVDGVNQWVLKSSNKTKANFESNFIVISKMEKKCDTATTISLSSVNSFNSNCYYRAKVSSISDYIYPRFVYSNYLVYDEANSKWQVMSNSKSNINNIITGEKSTITQLNSYCGTWNGAMSDDHFDVSCEYKILTGIGNSTFFATSVNSETITYSEGGTIWYIKSSNIPIIENLAGTYSKGALGIYKLCPQ